MRGSTLGSLRPHRRRTQHGGQHGRQWASRLLHVCAVRLRCGLDQGARWTLCQLRGLTVWLRRIGPPVGTVVARELLIPGMCIMATSGGVLSSTALLTAKVLPLVYGSIPANLVITPILACALTALVVNIRAYDQLRRSRKPAWLMRLLDCYCAGLLWPYWISTPLIRRLKRWRRKPLPRKRTTSRRTTKP